MDTVIPFEYGFLYKMIENPNWSDINNSLKVDSGISNYMNSPVFSWYSTEPNIQQHKYFEPIGYLSNTQKVIFNVVVEEKETTNGHLTMSGMSFQTTSIEKTYRKINRAEIDVNIFIKNFEKVL